MMSQAVEGRGYTQAVTGSLHVGANGLMNWDSGKVILNNCDPESCII